MWRPRRGQYARCVSRIQTDRLTLRPFEEGDLPAFAAYRSDPEVAAYQGWEAPYVHAERFFAEQRGLALGAPGEWVQIAIADRATDALLGDCATRFESATTVEIGITLARASQGAGIAREALVALLEHLRAEHGVERVLAEADDRNVRVHRLLEALGFREQGRFDEHGLLLRRYVR